MMTLRRVLCLLAAGAALGGFAGCGADAPPEFVSKADKFRVQFGAVPTTNERAVGGRRSVMYSVETPEGVRSVAITEWPLKGDEPPELIPKFLASARDDLVRGAGGKLQEDEGATLVGKYPGRRFAASVTEPKPGALRARLYLVGTKLYQVFVMGAGEYANSESATRFLDSFRLTE